MANFKYKEIPPFTRREEDALVFNGEGHLEYYIPEDYFGEGKSSSAIIEGTYVKLMGSFNYRIYDKSGKPGKLMTFNYPTMFYCKPNTIEKKKDISIDAGMTPTDYRILIFNDGDQLVTRVFIEKDIDNLSELFRLHIRTGRIPNTLKYNELYKAPFDCMELSSGKYKIHSQAVGLLYSKICRDPEDISRTFRESKAINKSMTGFDTISIKEAAKYVSPFVSLTSENMDDSIMSAILLTDEEKNGKKHIESPLEKILMM